MCRSIKFLRNPPATREEIEAAALQYVRKVSGFRKPSKSNADAFDVAVKRVADATESMLSLVASKSSSDLKSAERVSRTSRTQSTQSA